MKSIAARLTIIVITLILGTASVIGFTQYSDFAQKQLQDRQNHLGEEITLIGEYLRDVTDSTSRNTLFLAGTPPVHGLWRALENNGVDEIDQSTVELWRSRLETIFTSMMEVYPEYLQIRYISADESRGEIVRVNRRNNEIEPVLLRDLQSKRGRDYIEEPLSLPRGGLFISEITLNREYGEIELPPIPVLRVATPVYGENNQLEGVIVININMKEVFGRIQSVYDETSSVYLTNSNADFILHPDAEKEFRFEYGDPFRLNDEFGNLVAWPVDKQVGLLKESLNAANGRRLIRAERLPLSSVVEGPHLIAIVTAPEDNLLAAIRTTRNNIILITVGIALMGWLFALLSSRIILKPLHELTVASKQLQAGSSIATIRRPRDAASEVADLSASFFAMADTLEERQRRVEQSEAHIRAIFNTAGSPIVTVDRNGCILSANAAAATLTGLSVDMLAGRKFETLFEDADWRTILGEYKRAAKTSVGSGQFRREFAFKAASGSVIPTQISLGAVQVEDDRHYTCVITDLSEHRQRMKLEQDLSEQKRIDAIKNEFISTVSHELRTPLTSIMGSLGLIKSGGFGAIPEKADKLLDMAAKNGERLVAMINDILDIEKIESGKSSFHFQAFTIGELIRNSVSAMEGYASERAVALRTENIDLPATVLVDEVRFSRVMDNLLSNAVKFSPKDAEVVISVDLFADRVRVNVRDRGIGIPDSFRERVFAKFSQADGSSARENGGTGLGLNLAKAMIEKMNGVIDFQSTVGEGSVFFFDLPLHKRDATPTSADGATPISNLSKTVFIIEDDPDTVELLTHIVAEIDDSIAIYKAATVAAADAFLAANNPSLVIMDIWLGAENALDHLHQYFDRPKAGPELIIYSVEEAVPSKLPDGAQHYVKSRITMDSLREVVCSALNDDGEERPGDDKDALTASG